MCNLIFAVTDIKSSWKNLKDTYRRLFKAKHLLLKSGVRMKELDEHLEEKFEDNEKWLHYDSLQFLVATFTTKRRGWFLDADLMTITSHHCFLTYDEPRKFFYSSHTAEYLLRTKLN